MLTRKVHRETLTWQDYQQLSTEAVKAVAMVVVVLVSVTIMTTTRVS